MPDPKLFGSNNLREQGCTELFRMRAGSEIHGIQTGSDDHDVIGVALEPWEAIYGLRDWSVLSMRTARDGERSQPGDIDLVFYGLRKFARLAVQGNPSITQTFFTHPDDILSASPAGLQLLCSKRFFLSRRGIDRYLGYFHGQRQRVLEERGGKRGAREGRSAKWASHMVRLGYQGLEFARTGNVTLPMPPIQAEVCKAIKTGNIPIEKALQTAGILEGTIRAVRDKSPLPEEPNLGAVNDLLKMIYQGEYK